MRRLRANHETLRLPLGRRVVHGMARLSGLVPTAIVAVALIAAFVPRSAWERAVLALSLVALAAAVHHVLGRKGQPRRGWLVVDEDGVRRVETDRAASLVDWSEPLGLTVLASADRATLLLAFTSPMTTRYVPACVEDANDAAAAPQVFARATTTADSDLHAGDEAISAADAERLLAEVTRRAPAALDRVYLSDARGEPVVLDRAELRVGSRRFDLSAPLEWRAFFFQELGAHAASVCQATWVRQAEAEVVLVAPMPADGVWVAKASASARALTLSVEARNAVARDLRLMQASAGEPPPRELRRAIDRVFMLPLRRALDRAPRPARVPSSPSRVHPEGAP